MRIFIILFLFYQFPAYSGFEHSRGGARPRALGDAYVAVSGDPWSMYFNPAGLTRGLKPEASFHYSPQPYGLSELSFTAAAATIPVSFGVVGAGAGIFGFALYNETSVNVSVASTVSGIGIGMNISHYSVAIERYGSGSAIGIDAGLLVSINEYFRAGMAIRNVNSPTLGSSNEKLPQSFSTGMLYMPLQELVIAFDYQKDLSFDASPKLGIEYQVISSLAVRMGISDAPSEYHGGIGIRYSAFSFDYAVTTHQELGWTHEMSLSLRWGGYNEE
jgi:hypothetical protein